MPRVDVFFGGVGATQPRYSRGLPCIFLRWMGRIFILDVGEGCQESFLNFKLGVNAPLAVLISHAHGDHTLGLRPLLQTLSLNGRKRKITIIAPAFSRDSVLDGLAAYNYPVEYTELASEEGMINLLDVSIKYVRVPHAPFSYAYSIETPSRVKLNPEKLDSDKIRGADRKRLLEEGVVEIEGRKRFLELYVKERVPGIKVTYSGDTLPSHRLASLARGSDLLIHEATLSTKDWEHNTETPHSTPREAALCALYSKSRLLVIFHYSVRYRHVYELLEEAKRVFPRTILAERGMRIAISGRKERVFSIIYGFEREL